MKRVLVIGVVLVAAGCGHRSGVPTARSLSAESANHVLAGYSPDGKQIYWWQRAGDLWQLYRSPADLSAPESLSVTNIGDLSSGWQDVVWSPDGSRFAIGAARGSLFPSVWLMSATGGTPRQVSPAGGYSFPIGWNPDGKRLLYATLIDKNLYTMVVNVDSGAPRRLLPNLTVPHEAIWSPDGSKLAVLKLDQGRRTIWIADSVGGHLRQATTEGFERFRMQPTPWSRDGSALLYQSNRSGTWDIWVLPVDSSQGHQLTKDIRDDQNAVWSPDGRWVAFESNRGLQSDLWVKPASGGVARRVTDDGLGEHLLGWRPGTEELTYTTGSERRTLWSHALGSREEHQLTPDSLWVGRFALSSKGRLELNIGSGGGRADIATMPLGGGAPRTILRDARLTDGPHWSPDGSKLVFVSSRAGANPHVWVMDADGANMRQLTTWAEPDNGAVFTDDSTVVLESSHDARFGDLWRVHASGGEPTRLTHTGTVVGLCSQPYRPSEVLAVVVADAPVNFAAVRLRPGGVLQPIWNRTTGTCGEVSPATDSVGITVGAGADLQTMLVPLNGGAGRSILAKNQQFFGWSPDGRRFVFSYTLNAPFDLGVYTMADGSEQRVTNTPESEEGVKWSPDGSTLVFRRVVPVSRITTVDVTGLLSRGN